MVYTYLEPYALVQKVIKFIILELASIYTHHHSYIKYLKQWRIQEFHNGGARSRRGRIFRSGVCFDAPSHELFVFVARVVDKIHTVKIVYWLKSKYFRVIQSKFTKTNPKFFSKRGGARPARRSWIRLC